MARGRRAGHPCGDEFRRHKYTADRSPRNGLRRMWSTWAVSTYRFCWYLRLAAAGAGLTFEPSIFPAAPAAGVRTKFVRTNTASGPSRQWPGPAPPGQCLRMALAGPDAAICVPNTDSATKPICHPMTDSAMTRTAVRNGVTYQQNNANIGKVAPKGELAPAARTEVHPDLDASAATS